MRLPTIRQLQYFLAVYEARSFSIAAKNCHVTQSTLSAGLYEIESILGEKLFHRGTRHVEPTPLGLETVSLARNILEQCTHLIHIAQQKRAPLTGSLTLGIIPTIAPYLLPRILPELQISYPDLHLIIREDITSRQLDYLQEGRVDAVLMAFPYDVHKVEKMILWREPFYIARAARCNKKRKKYPPLPLEKLQQEDVLLLDDGHCLRDHIIKACRITPDNTSQKNLGATSLQTLLQLVQHGYGITLVPEMATLPEILGQSIDIQSFTGTIPTRQIGIAWRQNDARKAEFQLLGNFIKTHQIAS